MFKNGVFAQVSRVSIKTLRFDDEIDLLTPDAHQAIMSWLEPHGYRISGVGQAGRSLCHTSVMANPPVT